MPQDPAFVRVAESIQSYLAVVGVRVKLIQRESAAAREAARNGQADMFVKDWYADYPDAENFSVSAAARRQSRRGRQRVVLREQGLRPHRLARAHGAGLVQALRALSSGRLARVR